MSLRLLVVDDSAVMRRTIQRAIDVSSLPVKSCLTAEHGNAALSVLRAHEIDLMLVDLNMPEMRGDDLVRELQNDPGQKQIPFIVISADTTASRIQEMLDLGAAAYIPKPFAPSTLQSELTKVLEQMHAHS